MMGKRLLVVAAAAVVMLAAVMVLARAPLAGVLAASSRPGCPDVLLIGARGSGETDRDNHGLGPEVNAFFGALTAGLSGVTTPKSLLVVYQAADTKVLFPSRAEQSLAIAAAASPLATAAFLADYKRIHLDPFTTSIGEGIASAVDEITAEAAQCPHARLVLAGYSQGAMAMHQALLRLEDQHRSDLLDRIAATVLIADGDRKKETAATRFGTAPLEGEGVRSALTTGERDVPSSKASSTYDICEAGDIVCDFTLQSLIHSDSAVKVHEDSYKGSLVKNVAAIVAKTLTRDNTAPPGTTPARSCVAFVADVTAPDNTVVTAGSSFTKTWRLRNCGNTDWSELTAVRSEGAYGPATFPVPITPPNATAEVSVPVTAPGATGTFRATYRLRSSDGRYADNSFWVQVAVQNPAPTAPTVTATRDAGQNANVPAPPAPQPQPPIQGQAPTSGPPAADPGQEALPAGARELGGVTLEGYCSAGWGMHAVLRYPVAWGWRCSPSPVAAVGIQASDQDVSVDQACAQQYRSEARSHYRNYSDPYSWFCWIPG